MLATARNGNEETRQGKSRSVSGEGGGERSQSASYPWIPTNTLTPCLCGTLGHFMRDVDVPHR